MSTVAVPAQSTNSGLSEWRPDIQGLRGVAILLVVAFHAGLPIPGGFTGVDVFFVISGYVIGRVILRRLESPSGFSFAEFYARRIRRLLPALAVVLVTVVVLSALLPSPMGQPQETLKTAIGSVFLAANVVIERSFGSYFSPRLESNPLLNTWSLSVEEQFYLIVPAIVVIAWVIGKRMKWSSKLCALFAIFGIATVSMIILGAALASRIPTFLAPNADAFAFFSSSTRAWEFCAGLVLVFWSGRYKISSSLASGLLVVGLGLILAGGFLIGPDSRFPGALTLLPVVGTVLVIVTAHRCSAGRVLLANRPVMWLGDLSYSWYLWHWPLIVFAVQIFSDDVSVTVSAAIFSLGIALVSRRYVEIPFMTSSRISLKRSYVAFVAINALVLVAIVGVLQFISTGWLRPWSMNAHSAIQNQCDKPNPNRAECTWNAEDASSGTVLVVGDSNAWSSADGVIAAGEERNLAVVVASTNGCPFVSRTLITDAGPCQTALESSWRVVDDVNPEVLVIANNESVTSGEDKLVALADELPEAVREVLVIEKDVRGDDYSGRQSVLVKQGPGTRLTSSTEDETRNFANPFFSVLPLSEGLCSETGCYAARNGVEFFTDAGHLSRDGALQLAPFISDYLSGITRE